MGIHQPGKKIYTGIPMPGIPLTEVLGNRRVLIENHLGIAAYSSNSIHVNVSKGIVCIEGSSLEIVCISKEKMIVNGCIDCIRFCCGG